MMRRLSASSHVTVPFYQTGWFLDLINFMDLIQLRTSKGGELLVDKDSLLKHVDRLRRIAFFPDTTDNLVQTPLKERG